jgi:hypothetical protein
MLMSWLVPVAPPPTTDAPAGLSPGGSADLTGITAPGATTVTDLTVGAPATAPNGPAVPQGAAARTADTTTEIGPDLTAKLAAGGTADPDGATTSTPRSATPTSVTTGAVALPDGMTPTLAGPAIALTAPTTDPATTIADRSLLVTMQPAAEARATAAADTAQAQNTIAAATDLASLATDFGAQIVATSGPATSTDARADDAQMPATGSTAQAAGAVSATSVQLPGQAIAAAGAAGRSTGATLAEAPEAGPEAVAVNRTATDAPTEFTGILGPTGNTAPVQAATATQASAATAPPLTTQIADGAMLAARRIGQSVEMILQPEGLGAVTLRVTLERGGLGVHLAVENPQAREMVQASWPQLQQTLEQRGLTVQLMMLDLSSGGGGEGFQAFQQFSGQQARGGSSNGDRRGGPAPATVDESPHVQTSAGTPARVDYRI